MSVREASHIDFAHTKRQFYIRGEVCVWGGGGGGGWRHFAAVTFLCDTSWENSIFKYFC